jgi:hypothetical protein
LNPFARFHCNLQVIKKYKLLSGGKLVNEKIQPTGNIPLHSTILGTQLPTKCDQDPSLQMRGENGQVLKSLVKYGANAQASNHP